MLVLISDLHLTDGSCTATVSEESFHVLRQRLQELTWRGSWRADGSYRPVENLDLVLLGDTLDLIRSSRWLDGEVRPWTDAVSPELAATVAGVVTETLRENTAGLKILRALASGHPLALPPAMSDGTPAGSHERTPVPVRLHYMVGDHDWFLHRGGPAYDVIRRQVAEHLALVTPADLPFPHEPSESDGLLQVLRRHRVLARHGDVFDPLSYSGQRDQSSLSDVLTIQLVGRFRRELAEQLGDDLPRALAASLAQIEHVRPLVTVAAWLDGTVDRADAPPVIKHQVRCLWDRVTEEFLELEPVRELAGGDSGERRDLLGRTLRLRSGRRDPWERAVELLGQLAGGATDSYAEHALVEQDFRNRRAKHVVYGHTHRAETTALDASSADGFVLNQMYFNAGTWRTSFERTAWSGPVREFVPVEQINVLAFYQGDERGGRTFETCSHWLAPQPPRVPELRLDVPPAAEAPDASKRPVPGPHFRVAGRTVHR